MARLIDRIRSDGEERGIPLNDASIPFDSWANFFTFNGMQYPLLQPSYSLGEKQPEIPQNFLGYANGAFKQSPLIFGCVLLRMNLFSQATFKYRELKDGRPGKIFGTKDLSVLENPQPQQTTGDMLARMLLDADTGGSGFVARRGDKLRRLRPDWTTIVYGSMSDPELGLGDLDAEVLGYIYQPGGKAGGREPIPLLREEVAHFAPVPDPLGPWGMSWITPLVREIQGDQAMTAHKQRFFEEGAQPNLVVTFDGIQLEDMPKAVEFFQNRHGGPDGLKTLFLAAGSKAEALGADLKSVEFSTVQAGGELRIAMAAGIPPLLLGLKTGLDNATYQYAPQARRLFADTTMRRLWEEMAGSFSTLVPVQRGSQLWYDSRDIPFLQQDAKDEAEVAQLEASTVNTYVTAGFTPESATAAVEANDLSLLEHTGRYSVQLLPPDASEEEKRFAMYMERMRRELEQLAPKN